MLKQHRAHCKRESGVENASQRPEAAPPGRVKNLLVMVAVIHDVLAE